jgi:quercetin dioxygenase-like cupin family protein
MAAERVTRAHDAPAYHPPRHHDVTAVRLQGREAGPTGAFWVGLSTYAPGASAEMTPASAETVYVVLSGTLTVTVGPHHHVLRAHDSIHLPPGTLRGVINSAAEPATLLVVIAEAAAAA